MFVATFNRFAIGLAVALPAVLAGSTSAVEYGSCSGMTNAAACNTMPAYPVAWGYGGYGASTVAQGYLTGSAAVIDSMGNYALKESQAEIYREHARALDRENALKQTEALLTQKKMWSDALIQARNDSEARAAEGRKLIAEKQATIYRQAYKLSARELNMQTGEITWPAALQVAKFGENRYRIEELYREYVGYGAPNAETAQQIARSIDQWTTALRHDVGTMPREDYVAAQKFLLGLKYSAAST